MKEAADANRHTDPQLFGNLQGLSIQSHYQLRKPLVLHLLVALPLICALANIISSSINHQKHSCFFPPAARCLEGFFILRCISKYLLLFFKMCKKSGCVSRWGCSWVGNISYSHEMSGVVVSCHGWRFQLLDQNPDHVDEDDYVDLAKKQTHACWHVKNL